MAKPYASFVVRSAIHLLACSSVQGLGRIPLMAMASLVLAEQAGEGPGVGRLKRTQQQSPRFQGVVGHADTKPYVLRIDLQYVPGEI